MWPGIAGRGDLREQVGGIAAGTGPAIQVEVALGQQARHRRQQAVFARARNQFHHRVEFGQACLRRGAPGQAVAQAAAQATSRGLHGVLDRDVALARLVEAGGCIDAGMRHRLVPGLAVADLQFQRASRLRDLIGRIVAVRSRRRRVQRTIQRTRQGDRPRPVDPLPEPLRWRQPGSLAVDGGDARQQADESRARHGHPGCDIQKKSGCLQGAGHFTACVEPLPPAMFHAAAMPPQRQLAWVSQNATLRR